MKKGVVHRCMTPFFHCQRKYINSLFTNPKTIEKQGKNGQLPDAGGELPREAFGLYGMEELKDRFGKDKYFYR